jgi:hypothetical protein
MINEQSAQPRRRKCNSLIDRLTFKCFQERHRFQRLLSELCGLRTVTGLAIFSEESKFRRLPAAMRGMSTVGRWVLRRESDFRLRRGNVALKIREAHCIGNRAKRRRAHFAS